MRKKIEKTRFGEVLAEALKEGKARKPKITMSSIARACGIKPPSVHKWIRKDGEPSLANLCRCAEHLGVSTDYLLGRTNVSAPVTINGNQNAANIVDSTVSIGDSNARLEAEVLRLTRECERLCAENERLRAGQ